MIYYIISRNNWNKLSTNLDRACVECGQGITAVTTL